MMCGSNRTDHVSACRISMHVAHVHVAVSCIACRVGSQRVRVGRRVRN